MSEAFESEIREIDGARAVIEVRQLHPDYAFDAAFPERWGAIAAAGWAFGQVRLFTRSADGRRPSVAVPAGGQRLAGELGGFDTLFGGFDNLRGALSLSSFEVIREGYHDANREERMRAAGFSEEEIEDGDLTRDVVDRICGLGRLTVIARDASLLEGLATGMVWEY